MVAEDARTWWRRTWMAMVPWRGSLVGASVLICFDIVLCGSYMFSVLVCPVWFVVSVVKDLVQRPKPALAIARVLVPVMTVVLALANYAVQRSIATMNAGHIIQACETYREANGKYPDRLDQLVPHYMNSIPRAKYCCWFGEFQYCFEYHMLWWCDIPPFGRMVYDFDEGGWSYID